MRVFVQVTQAVANARRMAANREKMGGAEGALAYHLYAARAPLDTAVARGVVTTREAR